MRKESRVITTSDWEKIYNQMVKYNRREGFVDFVGDELTFFDSDPKIGGVSACFVTLEEVKEYANG